MFKAPEPYSNYVFFHNKSFVKKTEEGYALESKDTFVVQLRNSNKETQAVSLTQLNELYEKESLKYDTTWSLIKQDGNICFMVGDENEEYCVGKMSQFTDKSGSYVLNNRENLYYSDNSNEGEFYFNNMLEEQKGILTPVEENAYRKYISGIKDDLVYGAGIEEWYEYAQPRNKWKEENKVTINKEKVANYVNDKSYEKSIPYALRDRKQFIVWKWGFREDGKATKIPFKPWNIREGASSSDPSHWATFDKCCEVINKYGDRYGLAGIGIMFGRGIMGIDFDHCITNGKCAEDKHAIVEEIDSYTEYSPSGDGLHILLFGSLPEGYKNRNDIAGVEAYDKGRFFTLTGKPYEGKIRTIKSASATENAVKALAEKYLKKDEVQVSEQKSSIISKKNGFDLDDERIIELIRKGARKDTFSSLYDKKEIPIGRNGLLNTGCMRLKAMPGEGKEVPVCKSNQEILKYYEFDHSRCDMLLCSIIASYTDHPEQIDRIYRTSALMRDKWDAKRGTKTYGQTVCKTVLKSVVWKYTGKPHSRARKQQNILD